MPSLVSDLVPLREVPALLPRRHGRRVSIASVYRWIARGVARGPGRVRLAAVRVGGVLYVDPSELTRFLSVLSAHPQASAAPPAGRVADHQLAERKAQAEGL